MDGNKLDLRQIGTLFGNPIYVDVAGVHETKEKSTVLSARDQAEYKARKTLQKAFGMDKVKGNEDGR